MKTQNATSESNTICQELLSILPAYSLGTATPQEVQLVEALLPVCPEAAKVLADYQVLADNLVTLFPSTEEPPSSAALLQRIRSTPQAKPANQPIADHPFVQPSPARPIERPPVPIANKAPTASPVQTRRSYLWIALAACFLIAFVGTNIFWASQIDTLRRDQQSFLQTVASAQQNATLALDASNHHRDLLPADTTIKSTEASFVWNSANQIGALVVNGLPPLKQGETYQLWLVNDNQSLSLGTFETDNKGVGVVIFHSPQPVEQFSHVGVNVEPVGGTSKPTSPHLIIGNI